MNGIVRLADPVTPSNCWQTPLIIPLDEVSKSQAAAVSQRIANTEITLTYSRPVARGRELFGALVPYGEVWNPGADQATAIALTSLDSIPSTVLEPGLRGLEPCHTMSFVRWRDTGRVGDDRGPRHIDRRNRQYNRRRCARRTTSSH